VVEATGFEPARSRLPGHYPRPSTSLEHWVPADNFRKLEGRSKGTLLALAMRSGVTQSVLRSTAHVPDLVPRPMR